MSSQKVVLMQFLGAMKEYTSVPVRIPLSLHS